MDSIVLDDPADGYYRLWGKVRSIWKYLGQSEHLHHFDWFLKADDDTYIVVDNLRNFLLDRRRIADQEQQKAVWFGARLRHPKVYGGYHSGGAGYVLNRQALLLFHDGRNCSQINFGYEDLQMGIYSILIDHIDLKKSEIFWLFSTIVCLADDDDVIEQCAATDALPAADMENAEQRKSN